MHLKKRVKIGKFSVSYMLPPSKKKIEGRKRAKKGTATGCRGMALADRSQSQAEELQAGVAETEQE